MAASSWNTVIMGDNSAHPRFEVKHKPCKGTTEKPQSVIDRQLRQMKTKIVDNLIIIGCELGTNMTYKYGEGANQGNEIFLKNLHILKHLYETKDGKKLREAAKTWVQAAMQEKWEILFEHIHKSIGGEPVQITSNAMKIWTVKRVACTLTGQRVPSDDATSSRSLTGSKKRAALVNFDDDDDDDDADFDSKPKARASLSKKIKKEPFDADWEPSVAKLKEDAEDEIWFQAGQSSN